MLWVSLVAICISNPPPPSASAEARSDHAIELTAGAILVIPFAWSQRGTPQYEAAPGLHLLAGYSPLRYLAVGLELSLWPDRSWQLGPDGGAGLPASAGVFAEGRLPVITDALLLGVFLRGGLFGYVRSGFLLRWTPVWGLVIALDVGWEYLIYAGSNESSLAVATLIGWRFGGL